MERSEAENEATMDVSSAEEADIMMDHCIEVESNQRMRKENISPWTLRFRLANMEDEVSLRPNLRYFCYFSKPWCFIHLNDDFRRRFQTYLSDYKTSVVTPPPQQPTERLKLRTHLPFLLGERKIGSASQRRD